MESPEWVTIAILGKPRGNKGELLAVSLSDSPGRFESLRRVFLFDEHDAMVERRVENAWWHGSGGDRRLVLKFEGVDSIDAAETLQRCEMRVPFIERAPLAAGAYYQSDLIGCELIDAEGRALGKVTGWEEHGGAGLMEIEGGWLVPYTPAICKQVNVLERRILVDLPAGLKELNEA